MNKIGCWNVLYFSVRIQIGWTNKYWFRGQCRCTFLLVVESAERNSYCSAVGMTSSLMIGSLVLTVY